ncbi:MAG: hypothetical protein R3B68_11920 [Phycisphaerales bacterium]
MPASVHALNDDERPSWCSYPAALIKLWDEGVDRLGPWSFLTRKDSLAVTQNLLERYGRVFVPFAESNIEEFVCFEEGMGQRVLSVNPTTVAGKEVERTWESFADWLSVARRDAEYWD